jgi:ABC-type Fe3+ transport system substrate-binding protein
VTKAFTAATGISVNLVDDSTGPLRTEVVAEKNNPQWGVLWADGDTAFAALDQQTRDPPPRSPPASPAWPGSCQARSSASRTTQPSFM